MREAAIMTDTIDEDEKQALALRLVDQAKAERSIWSAQSGLLTGLTRTVLETGWMRR